MSISRLVFIIVIIILHGCTITPSDNQTTNQALPSIEALKQWQLSGKINLRDQHSSQTAYLNWSQCQQVFDIRLTGPLGQGAMHVFGDQNSATLQTPDSESSADNAAELLNAHVTWPLPIAQLEYWIKGIPDPNLTYQPSTEDGNFNQMNWHLEFKKWQVIDGYRLPKLAIASNNAVKITLLLKNWQLNTDCQESPTTP